MCTCCNCLDTYGVMFVRAVCDVEYNGSCYQLVRQQTDWFSAREHCHNDGGFLADAYTEEENNVIKQIVRDFGGATRTYGSIFCLQVSFR